MPLSTLPSLDVVLQNYDSHSFCAAVRTDIEVPPRLIVARNAVGNSEPRVAVPELTVTTGLLLSAHV